MDCRLISNNGMFYYKFSVALKFLVVPGKGASVNVEPWKMTEREEAWSYEETKTLIVL